VEAHRAAFLVLAALQAAGLGWFLLKGPAAVPASGAVPKRAGTL
jgi:hypothetical protein